MLYVVEYVGPPNIPNFGFVRVWYQGFPQSTVCPETPDLTRIRTLQQKQSRAKLDRIQQSLYNTSKLREEIDPRNDDYDRDTSKDWVPK